MRIIGILLIIAPLTVSSAYAGSVLGGLPQYEPSATPGDFDNNPSSSFSSHGDGGASARGRIHHMTSDAGVDFTMSGHVLYGSDGSIGEIHGGDILLHGRDGSEQTCHRPLFSHTFTCAH